MSSHKKIRLSGAQYAQKAREKIEREKAVLESTPKLNLYFSKITSVETISNPEEAFHQASRMKVNESAVYNDTTNNEEDGFDGDQCNSYASQDNRPTDSSLSDSNAVNSIDQDNLCSPSVEMQIAFPVNDELGEESSALAESCIHDPALWKMNATFVDLILEHGYDQYLDADLSPTRRVIYNKTRSLNSSIFYKITGDQEPGSKTKAKKVLRSWLIYSPSSYSSFCGPCKLFGDQKLALAQGYNDWSNVYTHVQDHENSMSHKSNVIIYLGKRKNMKSIDQSLQVQMSSEKTYWREVLKRVLVVTRSLSSHGLAFKGRVEKFGSLHNGNYLMMLEAIAEFDSLLQSHIKTYGGKGSGSVSYLSSATCDEFIELLANHLLQAIVAEVTEAGYFSISVDSTPDISHVDQLTFVIRYVDKIGVPQERFITFISRYGHKGKEIAQVIVEKLHDFGFDIMKCRAQSYDNAPNMSGPYKGAQACIEGINPLTEYVPCSAHSLNLVGKHAAEPCSEAVQFFCNMQELYNFFNASSDRWDLLMSGIMKTLKNLSVTRWSARADAVDTYCEFQDQILTVLWEFSQNTKEKAIARSEALGLFKCLNSLESTLIAIFWRDILNRFNAVSKNLQSKTSDSSIVVKLYKSLSIFVQNLRCETEFDNYENRAIEIFGSNEYASASTRVRTKKRHHDEIGTSKDASLTGRDHMRVEVYFRILELRRSELDTRINSYTAIEEKFGFLSKLQTLENSEISSSARSLVEKHPNDLEDSLALECQHLRAYLISESCETMDAQQLCKFIMKMEFKEIYPNVHTSLVMFLRMITSNCSGERSFSVLRRVKNYLRSRLSDEKLNALALLCIEAELNAGLDHEGLIDQFALRKARKVLI